jgi:hypothetical protein
MSPPANQFRAQGVTFVHMLRTGPINFWSYAVPPGHLSSHLADPGYWYHHAEGPHRGITPGDWLFAVHTTSDNRTYNILYCFTDGPLGIWAQQLLSSVPPISSQFW